MFLKWVEWGLIQSLQIRLTEIFVTRLILCSYSIVPVLNLGVESIRDDLVNKVKRNILNGASRWNLKLNFNIIMQKYDFCAWWDKPAYVEDIEWSVFIWDEPWRILYPAPKYFISIFACIRPFQPAVTLLINYVQQTIFIKDINNYWWLKK